MEDGSEVVNLSSPSKEEGFEEEEDGGKMAKKMRDLGSVIRFGGINKCSRLTEASKEEGTSQIIDTSASLQSVPISLMTTNSSCFEPTVDTCLSLSLADRLKSSENISSNVAPKQIKGNKLSLSLVDRLKPSENISSSVAPKSLVDKLKPKSSENISSNVALEQIKGNKEPDCHNMSLVGANLGLNDNNPFYPYKNLSEVRSVDASECGSTTGALEESDPLRRWKEMKQNGFLSSSNESKLAPKPRGRQPKRKKEEEPKKKTDSTKREQAHKYAKIAAPTGLLSGLNPGIIKHVRNSKQVNSIIEAMLQSEKSDGQTQNLDVTHISADNQFKLHLNRPFLSSLEFEGQGRQSNIGGKYYGESCTTPHLNQEFDDGSLTMKLSSVLTMASENFNSRSNVASSASHDTVASLSLKGASVASQWLDLLQQDIRGRLASLKRSKKRVRNVIQTELPYLFSKEIPSNQESEGYFDHSTQGECSKKAILDMHMARWKSIFSQMDKALYEEGKHLENWLKQVKDLKSHCEGGLKHFGANRTVLLAEEFSGLKKTDIIDRENAVRAAAASIYSTCNFIMRKENMPCF